MIDVYSVADDGSLSGPTSVPSVGAVPFGMAFDRNGARPVFVVADAAGGRNGTGAAIAYRLTDGQLGLIDGPEADHQIAPCWMVVTRDGRFAYSSDADSQAISCYRIDADGTLSLLDANGATATTPADAFPLEEGLSRDSRFLDVLDSRLLLPVPGPATLSGFRIGNNGHQAPVVDPAQFSLPFSAIGLAAD